MWKYWAGSVLALACALGSVAAGEEVVISAAGDCTLGTDESFGKVNTFPDVFDRNGDSPDYCFANVKGIFEKDDITIVNLETTLTDASKKADKLFRFKGRPEYAEILKAGSVECVNIANNHIEDYLTRGFQDTVSSLIGAGIDFCGMGYECVREVRGVRVGLLGYRGFAYGVDKRVQRDVARMKAARACALVVVSFHWGEEHSYRPNIIQAYLAHKAIDAGADLVVGHHPHVMQGIEHYKERPIVYSLGNFCFGGDLNPPDKTCLIYQGRFRMINGALAEVSDTIIPCRVSSVKSRNNFQPTPLDGPEAQKALARLATYNEAAKKPLPSKKETQTKVNAQ